jgi:hypothetical protein
MTSFLPVLLAVLPLVQDPAPLPTVDVIVLSSGEELRGAILVDTPTYLEIKVGSDTTIGIERSNVAQVRRGEAAAVAPARAAAPEDEAVPASLLAARDEWFVLHDGEGRCVGTLHASLRIGDAQEIKLAEEWDFATARGRTQVTQLETLRADGTPATCFYHERSQVEGERVPRDERLLRGSLSDGTWKVVRTTLRGSEQSEHAVGKAFALPLFLREVLRQRPGLVGSAGTRVLYDPARDELQQVAFVADQRRRAEIEGRVLDVRQTEIGSGARRSAEWIDGSGRVVRREVNGPALVAMRAGQDVARAMVDRQAKAYPAAVLREAEGRFSLWLPSPVWRFDAEQTPGQVTAHAKLEAASVSALILDQLAPDSLLHTAGDAVERWLRVVCRDFKLAGRRLVTARGAAALMLEGSYQGPLGERRARFDTSVLILHTPDAGFLALCFTAPANDYDTLRADFERMADSLEVHPAAVAAEARSRHKVVPR